MRLAHAMAISLLAALVAGAPMLAAAAGSAVVMAKSDLKWKDMGNGVSAAPVSGDMEKGARRFFLKYPVGLVTPKHRHDADHSVTVIPGTINIVMER